MQGISFLVEGGNKIQPSCQQYIATIVSMVPSRALINLIRACVCNFVGLIFITRANIADDSAAYVLPSGYYNV